jgi:hypothetical protein
VVTGVESLWTSYQVLQKEADLSIRPKASFTQVGAKSEFTLSFFESLKKNEKKFKL